MIKHWKYLYFFLTYHDAMVNPEKSRKKGGVQVCVLFPDSVYDDIVLIIETEKRYFKETDFIRKSVEEKIERIKKENPRLFER